MCTKVIASSLYSISTYERFHRKALLSDSRETCIITYFTNKPRALLDLKFPQGRVFTYMCQ